MIKIIVTSVMFTFAMVVGGCATQTTVTIPGVGADHPHIVSQSDFLRALRGNGAPTTNYTQAYRYATDTCNVLMHARPQDRALLASTYPANIQDATLRFEVYVAIHKGNVCVS